MKLKKKLYIQAIKHTWNDKFRVEVFDMKLTSTAETVVIDIDETEVTVECPDFSQSDFTNGHVEQLRKVKKDLQTQTHLKIKNLDEQIETLLAIENKV